MLLSVGLKVLEAGSCRLNKTVCTLPEVEGEEAFREGESMIVGLFEVPKKILGLKPDCVSRFVEVVLSAEGGKSVGQP